MTRNDSIALGTMGHKPSYIVTHINSEGDVRESLFTSLKNARKIGVALRRNKEFISLKNRKGVELPL